MKLLTADLHLTLTARDGYRWKFLQRLPALCRRYKVDEVIILGDLTERKDFHAAELVNRIVAGLVAITASGVEVTALRGNHDYADIASPFFQFLDNIEGITFIHAPAAIDGVLWLPHTRDYKADWVAVPQHPKYILTHNTFSGAIGDNGQELDGIPLSFLPKVPIFSGDVHVPQKLANVTYVGAPYTVDFGDTFQPRVLLLDTDGSGKFGSLTSLKLAGPSKRVLHVRHGEAIDTLLYDGDVVRVEVTLKPEDYANWAVIKQRAIDQFEHENVWLDGVIPVIAGGVTAAVRRPSAPLSDEELLKTYCQQRNIDADTMATGLELLK